MAPLLSIVIIAALGALGYAAVNFFSVKKLDEGTPRMMEIAAAIRLGANTFIRYEYKIVAIVALCIAVLLSVLISWSTGIAFLLGSTMSASAGWIGMKIATYANVRVTNRANTTKSLSETLKVAFKGGSVMGLCVGGFALLGIFIVYLFFGIGLNQIDELINHENVKALWESTTSLIGLKASFTMTLSGYALGCSIIAMFARVGGGIYTKAADMGADLVGKTELHIPEDDPRNPATIADNVGDNVGDVAGLGSDLLESFVGAILSGAILASELFIHGVYQDTEMLKKMLLFPIAFAGIGLISCIIGIASLFIRKHLSDNPHKELNMATWISAGITVVLGFGLTYYMFSDVDTQVFKNAEFNLGYISPWLAAAVGVVSGVIIGKFAEYYTSYDYKPTKKVAQASIEGAALTITQGMALGMMSCMAPVAVLGIAIWGSYAISGMYGVAAAAIGMLSFVAATVSVDTYGPISDNAGGIAEMSFLDKDVRVITDELDSVGNTTAAIGKGFAIGSAAFATLSMMTSYLFAYQKTEVLSTTNGALDLIAINLIQPLTLAGALVGAALPYLFSGMLIEAVAKAARAMVVEVRRQFREIKGLLQGEVLPDYKTCIEISSQGALKEMRFPAIMSISFPVICGFIFGADFVAGVLIGATISAIMLAIFTGNAGGAWDNAKKYIETGAIKGHSKGSLAHDAAVVGDTVGDPLKDTVGPSLDILIKIMSVVSLVTVIVFQKYNLVDLIGSLFK
ncbi:MAG: sodium-translocating pyrophosphatase [Clostridiales bacterium GWF2_38_85]|nr:MAG: sodium-translocating pyrophosphatase [Clostridiales bacterium GWF2_38_85]HBL83693.1 sodium-translocating pyrophosphatase [Clostridiales bacterium]